MSEYFKATVFYNNVKTAIRGAKADCDRDFLEIAICDVQDFPRSRVIEASVKGLEPTLDVLSKSRHTAVTRLLKSTRFLRRHLKIC